ncbi:MAG TPA: long-chain fatty acid--CoA ligase [Candidatus Dormibacteraeota bacterium]|nr:long-chain fatty acid--CoA ligase [Candidatus Dormibacteraeota bacterium]
MDTSRLSDRTTIGLILRRAERSASLTCLKYHDGSSWQEVTWDHMRTLILRVAGHLVREGVEPGQRVVLLCHNRYEWLACDWGIQAAGAVTVPIYPSTTATVAASIIANSEAVLGIAESPELAANLAPLRTLLIDGEIATWLKEDASEVEMEQVTQRLERLGPDDLVTIVYTSGTTGLPKGVMLAHRNLVDIAHGCLSEFDISARDTALSYLPFSHVLERINGIFVGATVGASVWLSRGSDHLMEEIQECRPTLMISVPRFYEKVHQAVMARVRKETRFRRALFNWAMGQGRKHARGQSAPLLPLAERLVLSALRERLTGGRLRFFLTGGAPISPDIEEFFWALGVSILQGWGMTETSSGATSNTLAHHRYGTVGRPLGGVELRLDADGEILVKSPGNMLGYFHDLESTAATLEDGWVRTGDVGEIDGDGYLRITDRKKDLIKTAGGKYVAPQAVESELQQDPLIERAIVIGDLRPYVTALVVPDWEAVRHELGIDGDETDMAADGRVRAALQSRIDRANGTLGQWETVKRFAVLAHDLQEENGELTPTLKVKRRVVQERYETVINDLYDAPREATV